MNHRMLCSMLVLGLFPVCASAQLSVQPFVGYGIGTGKQVWGTDYEENEQDSTIRNENLIL